MSRRWIQTVAALVVAWAFAAAGCSSQQIRYYQTEAIAEGIQGAETAASDIVLGVEDFSTAAAYDEQRIVYRTGPFRFDYYHYHRWAAPPGMLVAEQLRRVYQQTGAFKAVVDGYATRTDVVLSGRVLALEEVDISGQKWVGRVRVQLRLRDAVTGELLWSRHIQTEETLDKQSPSGLAKALSQAITRTGVETADKLVRVAREAGKNNEKTGSKPAFQGGDGPSGTPPGDNTQ